MASGNDPLDFAQLMPDFNFMRQFAQAAPEGPLGAQNLAGWMPPPAVSIEEIDKRITELKSVQLWLEQNLNVLRATVQALEVQKMALATLQHMNVNLADIAQAFTQPPPAAEPAAAATPEPPSASAATKPQAESVPESPFDPAAGGAAQPDPLQWWNALTQQFQTLAARALRDAAQAAPPGASTGASDTPPKPKRARQSASRPSARPPASAKSTAQSAAKSGTRSTPKPVNKPANKRAASSQPSAPRARSRSSV